MKILILGDTCIDETIQIRTGHRSNPEDSSVPIETVVSVKSSPGMASNVERILFDTIHWFKLDISVRLLTRSHVHTVKQRFYNDSGKYVRRVDWDIPQTAINKLQVLQALEETSNVVCVVSDYDKGSITRELLEWLDAQVSDTFTLIVDSKKRELSYLTNAIVKINTPEYTQLIGSPPKRLIQTNGPNPIIVREGHLWTYPVQQISAPINVCGAGDAFTAGLAIACASGRYSSGVITPSMLDVAVVHSTRHITGGANYCD